MMALKIQALHCAPTATASPYDAAREAVTLAKQHGCKVVFVFNGIRLEVRHTDAPKAVADVYLSRLMRRHLI